MASPVSKLVTLIVDHRGKIAKVAFLIAANVVDPSSEGIAAITAAVKALIRGKQTKRVIKKVEPVEDTVTDSALESIEDRAVLRFACSSNGNTVRITVPSPIDMFASDGVTVDPTNVPAAALIAAVIGKVTDHTGALVTSYLGGSRYRTALQKA